MLTDPQLAARDMIATLMHPTDRRHARDRRADQALGHAGERAHAAAGARPAHRRACWANSGIRRTRSPRSERARDLNGRVSRT